MKTLINSKLIAIVLIAELAGCKKNAPTQLQVHTGMLTSHSWNLQSLQVDNIDKTSLYPGTYTALKGAPVWSASGAWSFIDDGKTIKRDDQIEVSVDQISDTQLVLSLNWNQTMFAGGKVGSVSGRHVYSFVK
jgi:hypothetical protein